MARLMITGARGQLGRELAEFADRQGDDVVACGHGDLDITDAAAVGDAVSAHQPDAIINCAAWTNVDACESDPERADLVNATAVGYLRTAADAVGAHLVQVSTDYVFDGANPSPYAEDARPNPMSVYGRSKLAGERAAQAGAAESATVVRTSWVCGRHGRNMVSLVIDLMETQPQLRFVTDQIGNPSFTADLVAPLHRLATDRIGGVFHLTNSTPDDAGVSWYEFVADTVAAAGGDPGRVVPILTADLQPPRPAPRPTNSVLANTKLARLRDYREPLAELVEVLHAHGAAGE